MNRIIEARLVRNAVSSAAFNSPVAFPLASSSVTTPLGAGAGGLDADADADIGVAVEEAGVGGGRLIIFVPMLVWEVKGMKRVSWPAGLVMPVRWGW